MHQLNNIGLVSDLNATLSSIARLTRVRADKASLPSMLDDSASLYFDAEVRRVGADDNPSIKFVPFSERGYKENDFIYLLFRRRAQSSQWVGTKVGTEEFLYKCLGEDKSVRPDLLRSVCKLVHDPERWQSADGQYNNLSTYLKYSLRMAIDMLPADNNGIIWSSSREKLLFNTRLFSRYGNYIILLVNRASELDFKTARLIDSTEQVTKLGFATEERPEPTIVKNIPSSVFSGNFEDFILDSDARLTHIVTERISRITGSKAVVNEWEISLVIRNSVYLAIQLYKTCPTLIHPMYCYEHNEIQFLIPVIYNSKTVGALVVRQRNDGKYVPQTVLDLSTAYSNARVIKKPNDDWLSSYKEDEK